MTINAVNCVYYENEFPISTDNWYNYERIDRYANESTDVNLNKNNNQKWAQLDLRKRTSNFEGFTNESTIIRKNPTM